MTLHAFWIAVALTMQENSDWRLGQAAFNTLQRFRPDLAAKVRGNAQRDPFYAWKKDDRRFKEFAEFLEENW